MNKKGMAISQSILLVFSILAFAFMLGGSLEVVSATDPPLDCSDPGNEGKSCEDNSICSNGECISECVARKTGVCGAYTENTCSGTIERGLCPGDSSMVCCVSPVEDQEDQEDLDIRDEEILDLMDQEILDLTSQEDQEEQKILDLTSSSQSNTPTKEKEGILKRIDLLGTAKDYAVQSAKQKALEYVKNLKKNTEDSKDISDALASNAEKIETANKELQGLQETLNGIKDKDSEAYTSAKKAVDEATERLNPLEVDKDALEKAQTNLLGNKKVIEESALGSANWFSKTGHGFFNKVPIQKHMDKAFYDQIEKDAIQKAGKKYLRDLPEGQLKEVYKGKIKELSSEQAGEILKDNLGDDFVKKTKDEAVETVTKNAVTNFGYAYRAAGAAAMGATLAVQAFKLAGAGERNIRQLQEGAVVAGTVAWGISMATIGKAGVEGAMKFGTVGLIAAAGVALWAAVTYQTYSQEIFTYRAGLWEPPRGGENCQDCNTLPYGCSEYQCHTFGAGCELINKGTDFEECDWNNSNDFNPPIMTQLDILDIDYKYDPIKSVLVNERGVKLLYNGEDAGEENCIKPFTGVKFGIKTDEPAQCRIDLDRKFNYEEMVSLMVEGAVYTYNHTIEMPSSAFPSEYALNEAGWSVDVGAEHNYYMRCIDKNGNLAPAHFVMNFCVEKGPDTTPPTIETKYVSGAYITHDTLEIPDVEVYTNEPAECRWDFKDTSYDKMAYEMDGCLGKGNTGKLGDYTFPEIYSYGCKTTLKGIKAGVTNNYFIRCEDKPTSDEGRRSNKESYVLSLTGTNELAISEITANEIRLFKSGNAPVDDVKYVDSRALVPIELVVETAQGAETEGQARCSYNPIGSSFYYDFYNNGIFDYTNLNEHMLYLEEDFFDYNIKCCDLANNCDSVRVNFTIETDLIEPEISRMYAEGDYMKFITTEESECVYGLSTCNYLFEDGSKIETVDNLEHFTVWDTESDLYVKCKDGFGNVPNPDECSIIARANKAPEQSETESIL